MCCGVRNQCWPIAECKKTNQLPLTMVEFWKLKWVFVAEAKFGINFEQWQLSNQLLLLYCIWIFPDW
jgi:hypothetical protein